jgi:hypothetical protein
VDAETEDEMRFKIAKNPHLGDPHLKFPIWGGDCGCWGGKRNGEFDALIIVGGLGPEPTKLGLAYKLICVASGPKKIDEDDRGGAIWVFKDKYENLGAGGPDLRESYPALAALMYPGCRAPRVYETGTGNDALDRELTELVNNARRSPWGRPT